LEDHSRVREFKLRDGRQNVGIRKDRVLPDPLDLIVFYFSVNSNFRLIVHPLTDKELIFRVVVVRSLAFSQVINPVALEMVSVPLGEHPVAVPLALVPLTFVNILVLIDHPALSLRHTVDPVSVVSVSVFIEERASAVLAIFKPISSVLSPQFAFFISPESTLSVSEIFFPHALVLVAVLIKLDPEALLAVILPVSDIPAGRLPGFSLDRAILLLLLLLHPVDRAMGSVLLGLGVADFPGVDEFRTAFVLGVAFHLAALTVL
jgi:hypothetical protein